MRRGELGKHGPVCMETEGSVWAYAPVCVHACTLNCMHSCECISDEHWCAALLLFKTAGIECACREGILWS